jgi:hypothetical protein
MTVRSFVLAFGLLLLAGFTLMNWDAFLVPTQLSLGVTQVQAPLGLVMLVVLGVVTGWLLAYILLQQASVIMESRRMTKDLHAQRELADKAEASRFTEMRAFVAEEMRRLEAQAGASTREVGEAIAAVEQRLGERLSEATRTLSAYVGEVEDKIDQLLPSPRT